MLAGLLIIARLLAVTLCVSIMAGSFAYARPHLSHPNGSSVVRISLDTPLHCIAAAVNRESRGSPTSDKRGIGWTVTNRLHTKGFPHRACDVIKQKDVYTVRHHKRVVVYQFPWEHTWKHRVVRKTDWQEALRVAAYVTTHPPKGVMKNVVFFNQKGLGVGKQAKLVLRGKQFNFYAAKKKRYT